MSINSHAVEFKAVLEPSGAVYGADVAYCKIHFYYEVWVDGQKAMIEDESGDCIVRHYDKADAVRAYNKAMREGGFE